MTHPLRFFSYFGGKRQHAQHYPGPRHRLIVEPFAGSAGYATYHCSWDVILIDSDPAVVATWRYLIRAEPAELLALPDVPIDGTVYDVDLTPEQRVLAGWWLSHGRAKPAVKHSSWSKSGKRPLSYWGPALREKLALQVPLIRHWEVREGSYVDAPDVHATWYIDPPYQVAGAAYRHGSQGIDYASLAEWCRQRRGQVIVCEQEGADWLPFEPFRRWWACVCRGDMGESAVTTERAGWIPEDHCEWLCDVLERRISELLNKSYDLYVRTHVAAFKAVMGIK